MVTSRVVPLFNSAPQTTKEDSEELSQYEEDRLRQIEEAKSILGDVLFNEKVETTVDNMLFTHWVMTSINSVPTTSGLGIPEHVEHAIEERYPGFFPYYMENWKDDPDFKHDVLHAFMFYSLMVGVPSKDEPWGAGVSTAALSHPSQRNIMRYLGWVDKMNKKRKGAFTKGYPKFPVWKQSVVAGTWSA